MGRPSRKFEAGVWCAKTSEEMLDSLVKMCWCELWEERGCVGVLRRVVGGEGRRILEELGGGGTVEVCCRY